MLHSKTKWKMVEIDHIICQQRMQEWDLPMPIVRMLMRRDITTKEQVDHFLSPSLNQLHSPFLLDGMERAVERVRRAIDLDEKIFVYGDYDVDGVSSTSVLLKVLEQLNANVEYYIPNRFEEGYGLHKGAISRIKEEGGQLIITVDTGISAVLEAEYAAEMGLDLIITDHHEPPEKLPHAYAIINPKKKTCSYPFKDLAGVGVTFKLATALLNRVAEDLLDIVALGTIADLVPLVEENRVLVTYGLRQLNLRKNRGLSALLEVSGVNTEITEGHVGFSLGPRINASGRLESAHQAVELLMTTDATEARCIAERLDELNQRRQRLVEEMTEQAMGQIETNADLHRHLIVVAQADWNAGVVGIVASRLMEKYYRPVIVLSIDEASGIAKGSARCIPGFNLYDALTECNDVLLKYGGHTMAAGMSMNVENIQQFHQRMSECAERCLTKEDYISISMIEDELFLEMVNEKLIAQIKTLAPFGMGNPVPHFMIRGASISRMQLLGEQRNHLKLSLKHDLHTLDAIGFRFGDIAADISQNVAVDVVGELQMNEWNGRRSPQVLIRDLAVQHLQVFDWRSNRDVVQRLEKIDSEKYCYVCSIHSSAASEVLQNLKGRTIYWEKMKPQDVTIEKEPYVVFVDPPPTMEIFDKTMKYCEMAERLYFVFGDKGFDDVLIKMPSRDDFKRVYVALLKKGSINMSKEISVLVHHTGLEKKVLLFIIRILEELQLIIKDQFMIRCTKSPGKRELVNSSIYREQLAKEKVLDILIQSTYTELCRYVLNVASFMWHPKDSGVLELQK